MKLIKTFITTVALLTNLSALSSIQVQYHTFKNNTGVVPVRRNNLFYNNIDEVSHNHFLDGLKIFWKTKTNRKKYHDESKHQWQNNQHPQAISIKPCFTWIGHATFLIQINGFNILTDPVFGNLSILYKRVMQPGISLEQLPPIDFILLSHNHRDHCDKSSLRQIAQRHDPICLVPQGMKRTFNQWGFAHVLELDWWEHYSFGKTARPEQTISFTFVPVHHWSQHELTDAHKSLWGGWIIEDTNKNSFYFAGDTAYNKQYFEAIAHNFPSIDVAFMPIGPCEPRGLTKHSHVNAHEAVRGFLDVGAKQFVPMHWGTFKLGCDSFVDPITQLNKAWKNSVSDMDNQKSLWLIKCGQQYPVVY